VETAIAVTIVAAILVASAVYIGGYLGQRTLTGWGDTVVNDIKAAQQLGITRRALVTMTFTGRSGSAQASYATTIGGVTVRGQTLPSELDLTSITLQFNTLGAPTSPVATTLTLSDSRSNASVAVTIVPVTGAVWAQ